jgi:hypothetical protein
MGKMGLHFQECVLGEEIQIGFGPLTTNHFSVDAPSFALTKTMHQHFIGSWIAETEIRDIDETSNREFV